MGCVASRTDKDERVQVCRQRKRLVKQLVRLRGQFADAQLIYLRALKNTGVTLRQFTESESLELENTPPHGLRLPPLPPPPLPPSPPPPPPLSPELRKVHDDKKEETAEEEILEINENGNNKPPPPPIPSSSWDYWDLFPSSPEQQLSKCETAEQVEEENWEEAITEFEEEDGQDGTISNTVCERLQQPVEQVDDNSSMMSWYTKDTTDMAMVVWRSKKTLDGIIKELDDYFLKASAGGKEIAVLMDINKRETFLLQNLEESKRNRNNSAKVFSALSWSWSSKSLRHKNGAASWHGTGEPCGPGAHCVTLAKLCAAEQKLYKDKKEEERTKVEHERKSILLQKQEEENNDWTKIEKTRMLVQNLEVDVRHLQHSINETCSSILTLIRDELYPQLVAIISGLTLMWRTMYECHEVQNHISQWLNHLPDNQSMDFTTAYRHQATAQLETEVTSWYISFCKLTKSQRDYVRTLCGWIQLTGCLVDDHQQSECTSAMRKLCENWQLVFEKLQDKVASEAIKSFLSAIHSIFLQQIEEQNLHKKSDRLEKRLQKELNLIAEMQKKFGGSFAVGDACPELSLKHPLILKSAKVEALKKQMETEKTKYLNSIQVTKAMTLNNLKTSLPNVFQALMEFSNASAEAFEAVLSDIKVPVHSDAGENQEN